MSDELHLIASHSVFDFNKTSIIVLYPINGNYAQNIQMGAVGVGRLTNYVIIEDRVVDPR